MTTAMGTELAQGIRQKISELKQACAGLDEAAASRAPAGRWSPKEILSHLWGRPDGGHLPILQKYLLEDVPTIDLVAENTYLTGERAKMTLAQLLAGVEQEYEAVAAFAAGLTEAQLARTARIPLLKESPLGEYPTLGGILSGLGTYHTGFHIEHLREVRQALSA